MEDGDLRTAKAVHDVPFIRDPADAQRPNARMLGRITYSHMHADDLGCVRTAYQCTQPCTHRFVSLLRQAQIKSRGADKNTRNLLKSLFLLFRFEKLAQTNTTTNALMKKLRTSDKKSGINREFVFQKLHASENDDCGLSVCLPCPPGFYLRLSFLCGWLDCVRFQHSRSTYLTCTGYSIAAADGDLDA